jgi:hypothetical protein
LSFLVLQICRCTILTIKIMQIWYFKSIYRDKFKDISYTNMYLYILVIKYGESKLSNTPICKQIFFYIYWKSNIYTYYWISITLSFKTNLIVLFRRSSLVDKLSRILGEIKIRNINFSFLHTYSMRVYPLCLLIIVMLL